MKKIVVLLLIFSACKKAENKDFARIEKEIISPEVALDYLKTDTIFFDENTKTDFALAHLVQQKWGKDSSCVANYKMEFFLKSKIVFSQYLKVEDCNKESDWYGHFLFDTKKFPLITIGLGYPACGYAQSNFVFYIDKQMQQLVNSSVSIADAPYSNGTDFFPIYENNIVTSFYSKNIAIGADDAVPYNDENENLIISFSDSTVYKLKNKKWSATLVTPKDKVYRKINTTFDEYFK